MNTIRNVMLVLVAACAGSAFAQQGIPPADPVKRQEQKKADFAQKEQTLQSQSRSSAAGSPRVDKSVEAADPIPKATTKQEKKARFAQQQQALESQSRSSASGSPGVDKTTAAASPVPGATSKSQKKARFKAHHRGSPG